jgi:membrane-bound serine protease (ClpP class)
VVLLLAILLALVVLSSPWSIVVLVVGAILEFFEIRFLLAWSRRLDRKTKPSTGEEAMIGRTAEVVEPCSPRGTVRYAGELWEAEADGVTRPGDNVRIDAVDGLLLRVSVRR